MKKDVLSKLRNADPNVTDKQWRALIHDVAIDLRKALNSEDIHAEVEQQVDRLYAILNKIKTKGGE